MVKGRREKPASARRCITYTNDRDHSQILYLLTLFSIITKRNETVNHAIIYFSLYIHVQINNYIYILM